MGKGFLFLIPLVPYGPQHYAPEFGSLGITLRARDYQHEVSDTVPPEERRTCDANDVSSRVLCEAGSSLRADALHGLSPSWSLMESWVTYRKPSTFVETSNLKSSAV